MVYVPKNKQDQRNKSLIVDYLSGKFTMAELVGEYKCSSQNIYRILKEYNIPVKQKPRLNRSPEGGQGNDR